MSGYIIAQINVKNIENYQEYLKKVTVIAKKYDGEYIVRAGNFEIMEGVWPFKRNVIIKFPTIDKAKDFYNSEEYNPVKKIRIENSESNLIIIDGGN